MLYLKLSSFIQAISCFLASLENFGLHWIAGCCKLLSSPIKKPSTTASVLHCDDASWPLPSQSKSAECVRVLVGPPFLTSDVKVGLGGKDGRSLPGVIH